MASIVNIKTRKGFKAGMMLSLKGDGIHLQVSSIAPVRDDFLICLDAECNCYWLRPDQVTKLPRNTKRLHRVFDSSGMLQGCPHCGTKRYSCDCAAKRRRGDV